MNPSNKATRHQGGQRNGKHSIKDIRIELKDLETVSGGTVAEFSDLLRYLCSCGNTFYNAHIPGVNNGTALLVEKSLKNATASKQTSTSGSQAPVSDQSQISTPTW